MVAIHIKEPIELESLDLGRQAVVAYVAHASLLGRDAGVAQRRSLIDRGKECRPPVVDAAVRERRADGHEAGEIAVFTSKSIIHPRANAGADEVVAAGMELHHRAAVRGV